MDVGENIGYAIMNPLATMQLFLFGCLRPSFIMWEIARKHQYIEVVLPISKKIRGNNIVEVILSKERENIPYVVWGSRKEFHGYFMAR